MACGVMSWEGGIELAGVADERGRMEQLLKRPASSQVKADAAGGVAHTDTDFEQLGAQSFDLC
jgi:hypothetical protein